MRSVDAPEMPVLWDTNPVVAVMMTMMMKEVGYSVNPPLYVDVAVVVAVDDDDDGVVADDGVLLFLCCFVLLRVRGYYAQIVEGIPTFQELL